MNKIELLAPAKDINTAIAAINCGADAVYIGADSFGARVNAANNLDDIKKLVDYAHKFYVRVHVTINTILTNAELNDAIKLINKLYEIGVDAIIVQDMGILQAAIEEKIPPIQIHMSTQCDNRSLEKVKFFDSVGASRVILARELSLSSIEKICKNTNCEIETFIHGALCVSYSGQCYMSYANGGRSANKGACAQPCRKRYSLVNSENEVLAEGYLLSLKDFNASKYIQNLIQCGVNSFKIEGRLKDENYVKNITLYYNNLINKYSQRTSSGKVFTDISPNPEKTFNRLYTDYFLERRKDCYNFLTPKSMGERIGYVKKVCKDYFVLNSNIYPQDGICYLENGILSGFLINKVDGNKIYPNRMPNIKVGQELYRNYDAKFNKLLSNSIPIRKIMVNFYIYEDKIIAEDEDFNRVKVNIDSNQCPVNREKLLQNFKNQLSKTGESDFYANNIEFKDANIKFIPISQINNLRRNLLQKLMKLRIENYQKNAQNPIRYSKFPLDEIDYKANVLNSKSREFYANCGCKVCEGALEANVKVPSNIELMRTKHCLRYSQGICSKNLNYTKDLYLKDENGKMYPLKFDCKNCEMVVLNP